MQSLSLIKNCPNLFFYAYISLFAYYFEYLRDCFFVHSITLKEANRHTSVIELM